MSTVIAQPVDPALPVPTWEDVESFVESVAAGNLDRVAFFLHSFGANVVNEKNSQGVSPIVTAAARDRVDVVELLLNCGADVHARTERGETALLSTVSLDPRIATLLLQHGADVNAVDGKKLTAMHRAAIIDKVDTATVLLANGASINVQNVEGKTPLMQAVICNSQEMVAFLMENGADPDIMTPDGEKACDLDIREETCAKLIHTYVEKREQEALEKQREAAFVAERAQAERQLQQVRRLKRYTFTLKRKGCTP